MNVPRKKKRHRSKTFQKKNSKSHARQSAPVLPSIIQLDRQAVVNHNWIVAAQEVDTSSVLSCVNECEKETQSRNRRSVSFQFEKLTSATNISCAPRDKTKMIPIKSIVHNLVLKILKGEMSLPSLMNLHSTMIVLKVLKHKRMHQNAGWFQSFVNSKDSMGNTALHVAAKRKSIKITKALLKYNALENVLDQSRLTPLDIAVSNSHFKMCLLLLKTGSILGPTMYENTESLNQCETNIVELLKSYNQPSRQMQIGLLSSPTNQIYVPPLHMYEVPFEFKSEQYQLNSKEQSISEYISNVSSNRTTTSQIQTTKNSKIQTEFAFGFDRNGFGNNSANFFDSFVDFR